MGSSKRRKFIPRLKRGLFRLGVFGKSIARPVLAAKLLRHVPMAQRGFRFAQKWTPDTDDTNGIGVHDAAVNANRLREYFDGHQTGPGIWKWLHYFDVYDRHFRKFVGREVHVLEIGIFSGGSLAMWHDYFGDGCRVYGVDVDPSCTAYADDRTEIFIGDQADRNFWRELRERIPRVDILVDDGGHKPVQQVVTLEEGLPHISPGGVYVCEDVHGDNNGFAAYVQGVVQHLNASNRIASGRFHKSRFQRAIHSVHSYPFVTVVEKTERDEEHFLSQRHGTEWKPM